MKSAVFLDRDGTLNDDPGYLKDPELVILLPGVAEGLRRLGEYSLIIISNQSGIGREYLTEEQLGAVNFRLRDILNREGIKIEAFYHCPHLPDSGCDCRKPNPGMLLKATNDYDINLSNSFMIGDRIGDIKCGHNAGVKSILVMTGYGPNSMHKRYGWSEQPDYIARNMVDAADYIMNGKMNSVIGIIPARYQSSRFPGKPLARIQDKPMIQHVYERSWMANKLDDVVIATDDDRIVDVISGFNGRFVKTESNFQSGTDRVAWVAKSTDADFVINIQGDEPLIPPNMINQLVYLLEHNKNAVMATLARRIENPEEIHDPNAVKVIFDENHFALDFSRHPVFQLNPNGEKVYYKHIGMYGYRSDFLQEFVSLPESEREKKERLEQLRALDGGFKIIIGETDLDSISVDVPDDIYKVEKHIFGRRKIG